MTLDEDCKTVLFSSIRSIIIILQRVCDGRDEIMCLAASSDGGDDVDGEIEKKTCVNTAFCRRRKNQEEAFFWF